MTFGLLLACAAPPPAPAERWLEPSAQLTEAAQRGRRLYTLGLGRGAPPQALLATGPAPASAAPCASCHGADGRGRTEGGYAAPDLRARTLAQPQAVGARRRGPYTERTLRRAFTLGVDSAGAPLDSLMPRYALSAADAGDLVAWLSVLGELPPAGVHDHTLVVGVLYSSPEEQAAVQPLLEAIAAAEGPLYQRRLRLEPVAPGGPTDGLLALLVPGEASLPPDPGLPAVVAQSPERPPTAFGLPDDPGACAARLSEVPPAHAAAARRGLAGTALLVEATRRAGRSIDRARLEQTLEAVQSFDSGCAGRLDYGPNRRNPHGSP